MDLMYTLFFISVEFRQRDTSTYELSSISNDVMTPSVDYVYSLVHKLSCHLDRVSHMTPSWSPLLCKLLRIKGFQVQILPEKTF